MMFFQNTERRYLRMLAELTLLAAAIFALGSLLARAQGNRPGAGLGGTCRWSLNDKH